MGTESKKSAGDSRKLGFDDLVRAIIEEAETRGRAPEVASYYALRLKLLEEHLGSSFRRLVSTEVKDRDRAAIVRLAEAALSKHVALFSPFSVYLEGQPGPLEQAVRDRREAGVEQAIRELKEALRLVLADCIRALEPALEAQSVPEDKLWELGLPRSAPDLDVFW